MVAKELGLNVTIAMKVMNNLKQCQNNLWEHCWGVRAKWPWMFKTNDKQEMVMVRKSAR
jgi:hypothetical protein